MKATSMQLGMLLLRVYLGLTVLGHGVHKLQHGIDGIMSMTASHGLPSWVGYGVYAGEVLGPILVILGLFSRVGAGLIAINMLFAFYMVHTSQVFLLNANGGWALELQGFYFFVAVAICLMGSGRLAVRPD